VYNPLLLARSSFLLSISLHVSVLQGLESCLFACQAPASGDAATQRRAERARETAVAVLTAIVITSDLQASVCIEVLPSAGSGAFLCGPLLRYFRGSRLADSRWRLKESLLMQLLQLQLAHPDCLDVAVLLQVSARVAPCAVYWPHLISL
jgi:hypothetical protein